MNSMDEINPRIREMLADLPPASWAEAMMRLSIVHGYAVGAERSKAHAETCAQRMGVGLTMFYRLLDAYGRRRLEVTRSVRRTVRTDVHDRIMDAIAESGGDASPAQILRRASQMCVEAGLPKPSQQAVRVRYWRAADHGIPKSQFGIAVGPLLDRAHLDVNVGDEGASTSAMLTCVLDVASGGIVGHLASAGKPAIQDVADLVRRTVEPSSSIGSSVSDGLLHGRDVIQELRERGIAVLAGRWRMGAMIRSTVGLRLGRVQLLERLPGAGIGTQPVDLETVIGVVAELVSRSNRRGEVERSA